MFQFPEFAPTIIGNKSSTYWVAPFGYPWIYSYLPIPMAFRNLLRPSSPLKALGIPLCTLIYLLLYSCSRFCMSTRMSMISSISTQLITTSQPLQTFQNNVAIILSSLIALLPKLVENNGFEPLTLCVQGRCSSQLS